MKTSKTLEQFFGALYIADMGPDDLVLGYPWFAATNVQPNWAEGTLPTSVTIHTRGATSGKPMSPLKVAGARIKTRKPPFMDEGDELYIHIIKTECVAKTTVAQQLAEQATDKTIRSWDQMYPLNIINTPEFLAKPQPTDFPIRVTGTTPST